jgi:hypothetical protein
LNAAGGAGALRKNKSGKCEQNREKAEREGRVTEIRNHRHIPFW